MFCHHPLQEEKEEGDHYNNNAERRREMIVGADFPHELGVNQNREGFKTLADQHGRTKIREHTHEHQKGTCQQGGHNQRENDPRNPLECIAAQAFRRFVQGAVQIFQGTGYIHVYQGE